MNTGRWTTVAVLAALVLVCALWVVHNKQQHRHWTAEHDRQRAVRMQLEQEWAQLQLEEAALASPARVEKVARERRGMSEPVLPVFLEAPAP